MPQKEQPEPKLKNLPATSDLEPAIRQQVEQLMIALEVAVQKRHKAAAREDELKDQLEGLQKQLGRTGFRFEGLVYTAAQMDGRKTLDRMALMENGVSAEIINNSMKAGKPFVQVTFRRLPEEEL